MLTDVVQLYRESNRPPLNGSTFAYEGPSSSALDAVLATCEQLGEQFGRFEENPERDAQGEVSFRWKLAANEHARFYDNVSQLADLTTSPSQGIFPKNFYLLDNNYMDGEASPPAILLRLRTLVELVQLLGRLTQSLSSTHLDAKTLIFVIPAEERSPPRTFELQTRISNVTLELPTPELAVLRLLVSDQANEALHIDERRSLFRLAIADVLQNAPAGNEAFTYLISEWPQVLAKYQYDVDCYISNFSFDKVRKQIAASELEFVSKIQSIMGDSAAKILGLPLSFAAVIGIYHASTLIESELLVLGSLVIAVIFSFVVANQVLQLKRIDHGFRVVFEPLKSKRGTFSLELGNILDEAIKGFSDQYQLSNRALTLVRALAWLPVFVGTSFVAYRYSAATQKFIQELALNLLT
ncbi:hypothetical protein EKH79_03460 [Dyella dinghuensis]|uniref:Uncharacterized protein n=1 Tax=Dyella dinghuensis TaxID=1920169 RepID=A0A432LWP3_9GAMM|nr:hypothetical protein [Dyella dinghuensis]RUL65782.1 hypothetical protein EKH79_03460 [Dyella dinghuensis]